MRYKLTGFIACSAILLGACAAPRPPSAELSIESFTDELFRRHLHNLTITEELSLAEVYGDQWKEFVVFCPYWDGDAIAEDHGITDHPFEGDHSISESTYYLYLSDKAGTEAWIRFGWGVDFCAAGSDDFGLVSPSDTMTFQLSETGTWYLIQPPSQNSTEPTTTVTEDSPR